MPARYSVSTPIGVASMFNAGLMKFGPDLHVIPDLAVSIPTISSGGRGYTFTVRQDARFADGSRCTAAAIEASWVHALQDPRRSPLVWQYLGDIEGAGTVSRHDADTLSGVTIRHRWTIRIRLQHRDASFLDKLAFPTASVVKYLPGGRVLGMGPWALVGLDSRGSTILRPRRHYYGGPLTLQEVVLVPVLSVPRGLDLYRRNGLDAAAVPPEALAADNTRSDFHTSPALDAYYAIAPRSAGPALDDLLSATSQDVHLSPVVSSMTGLVPPSIPDYVGASTTIDTTVKHLPALGQVRIAPPADAAEKTIEQSLSTMWTPHANGPTVWIKHASFLLPDPGRWIGLASTRTTSRWFHSQLATAETLTLDPVTRMQIYNNLENYALSRGLLVPIASGNVGYLVKPRVQTLEITPLGLMPENNNWAIVSVS
jgi:ABC-type oligopeptide transport system substrate-binding subunit